MRWSNEDYIIIGVNKAIDDESKIMRQLNKPQNAYHQRFDRSG